MPKYSLTIVVSVLILIAVLLPGSNLPEVGWFGFDKIVHFGMFATWVVAIRYDLYPKNFRFHLVFLAGLFFSVLTEVLQIFIDGRNFDLYDVLADGAGVIVGLLVSKKIISLIRK
jgi:VanZ family protein